MAWKEVRDQGGGGELLRWENGVTVEGRITAIRDGATFGDGKVGKLLDFDTPDGPKTYPAPAVLYNRVLALEALYGEPAKFPAVKIRCLGKVKTKNGQAWNFEVYEDDGQ